MSSNKLEDCYIKFATNLTRTIRTVGLYPSKHPAVVYSIKNLYSALQVILNLKNAVSISLSKDGHILIEGQLIGEQESMLVEDLGNYFKRLEMESLTFNAGITDMELEVFIGILLMDPKEIKNTGGLNKLFKDRDIQHIKIAQFSYVKVEKGKAVVEIEKKRRKEILSILRKKLKSYSSGKMKKPEDIQALEKEVIETTAFEFKEKNKLTTASKNIFKEFLFNSEDKEGVLSKFKSILLESGCKQEDIDKLINKIEKELSEKLLTKAKKQEIGIEELESLQKTNEQLNLEMTRLKRELESKSQMLDELGKESKKITQEKERIDNIVHHMADGLVVVDPQGKIVMLNPVAEKLLGINKDSVGVALNNTVKNEHLLTMVKNLEPEKDGVLQKDVELLSPDESTKRVLRTSSAVIEDPNGKTVGMVTILNDITRQKELERMKSNFVASVSHELRTPLATIQQNISLMLKGLTGELNEDQLKFLNRAQDNIGRLKRLINDLLDTAAIEAGKFKLTLSTANLNEIINNVVVFLGKWAESKKVSLQSELLPGSPEIKIDKDRIEQILTNLIGNAMKFTPEGGRVIVTAINREPSEDFPDGAVEVSVRDTGMGISPEDLKRLFEKFERAGAANLGIGGTGLGLSICKEIVKLHGGRIWVESKLNEGSKFSFLLPRYKEADSNKEV